jgi:putative PIN family toxin of toxin-antitoxin system
MPEIKHRIVIDTNLWISFLLTRSLSKLDQLFLDDKLVLLVSEELVDEIIEVAQRPKFRKYFDLINLADLLANLRQKAEFIEVISKIEACRDEKDNFILSLAVDGAATSILTGDKDLLTLHPFKGIEILTVASFLDRL